VADGRTVKVIVDVVAPNGAEKAKKPLKDLEAEVAASNKRIEDNHKRTNKVIEMSDKVLSDFQAKEARRRANDFTNSLKQIQNETRKTESIFKSAFSGSALGSLAGNLGGKIVSTFASAISSLPGIITEAFNKSAAFTQATLTLAQFEGSAASAAAKMKELIQVANDTPGLTFQSAVEGQKRLEAVGFSADRATKLLKGLANFRVLSGSSQQDFDILTTELAKFAVGGEKAGVVFREIANHMPALIGTIKQQFGTLNAETIKAAGGPKAFLDKLTDAMAKIQPEFAASSLAAENFGDSLDRLQIAFGSIIEQNPEIISLLELWTNEINGTTGALMDNESQTRSAFSTFVSWVGKAGVSATNLGNLISAVVSDIGTGLSNVMQGVGATFTYILATTGRTALSMAGIIGEQINKIIDSINNVTAGANLGSGGLLNLPQLPRFSGVDGSMSEYSKAIRSYERGFVGDFAPSAKWWNGDWWGKTRKADIENADRWTEYDYLVQENKRRLARQKNATYPRSSSNESDSIEGGGGGRKGRKSRLSEAGIDSFVDNRTKAAFQRALAKLSPGLKTQIYQAAETYGIPESLALAQIFSESTFTADAKSPQGALGLTQGMPGTFGQKRFGGFTADQMKDPKNALTFWGKYMSFLFDRYGDWELATLAYHQGEGTVDQLVKLLDSGNKTKIAQFFKARPKGKSYAQKIKALSGLSGADQFLTTGEADSLDREKDAARELERSKQKILDLTKELGIAEADYQNTTQTEADASITRLEAMKDLTKDWQKQTEDANQKVWEIQNTSQDAGGKAEYLFRTIIDKANLSASDVEFLRQKFQKLKEAIDEARQATGTRPRLVPWQSLPGNEWGLPFQGDTSVQRTTNDRSNLKSFNEFNRSLNDQLNTLQRGGKELTEFERVQREIAENYDFLSEAQKQDILNTAQQIDATQKYLDVQEKVKGFFENVFDSALAGRWKSVLDTILSTIKDFVVKAAAQFASLKVTNWFFGGGGGGGSILGSLGSIFTGNQGGGIFNFGGGAASSASGIQGGIGSATGGGRLGGIGRMLGGLGGLFGLGAHTATAATAASTAAGIEGGVGSAASAGGGFMGSLGGLFTNPWTAVAAGAAIGGFFLFKHFFGNSAEKKLKKAAQAAFGVDIRDKNVLKQLKTIGEGAFGKGQAGKHADEVVQIETAKDIIEQYAEQTGQNTDKLGRNDYGNENWKGNKFGTKFNGFDSPSVSSMVRSSIGSTSSDVSLSGSSSGSANSELKAALNGIVKLLAINSESIDAFTEKFSGVAPADLLIAHSSTIGAAVLKEADMNQSFTDSFDRKTGRFV